MYDAIIVGGGISGLIAGAYLSKDGYKVLICEKEENVGGLVKTFNYNGFSFDAGIKAFEDCGVILPMIEELGIDMEFVENKVSIGILDNVIKLEDKSSLNDYSDLLKNNFPQNKIEIDNITKEIKNISKHLDVLYEVKNPIFLDFNKNKKYYVKTIFPWLFKFMVTVNKMDKLNIPAEKYLDKFTKNNSLKDIMLQHFFKETPTFFALSYFSLYLNYIYPKGGTGILVDKLKKIILNNEGEIKTNKEIVNLDLINKLIKDKNNKQYKYNRLIWACDIKKLYNIVNIKNIKNEDILENIELKKQYLKDKKGSESILSLYLTLDLDKSYFENICSSHFFYSPSKDGIHLIKSDKENIKSWIKEYLNLTTYEISIPVMKDESLAPKGKSGVIISTLLKYEVVKKAYDEGFYEEFKKIAKEEMINVINNSIYKGFKWKIIDSFVSTPLTIEKRIGSSDGAIIGWSFENEHIPSNTKMLKIAESIETGLPNVYKCGQWAHTPAGLPTCAITAKLVANKVKKERELEWI